MQWEKKNHKTNSGKLLGRKDLAICEWLKLEGFGAEFGGHETSRVVEVKA